MAHLHLLVFSAYARNVLANLPKPTATTADLTVYELIIAYPCVPHEK
jgi:hypothetical protein